MKKKKIKVKCPHCKSEFEYYSSDYRPFCSKRCKMIDLGKWLDEGYSVPAEESSIPLEEGENE